MEGNVKCFLCTSQVRGVLRQHLLRPILLVLFFSLLVCLPLWNTSWIYRLYDRYSCRWTYWKFPPSACCICLWKSPYSL